MYYFNNDYSEGAAGEVLQRLIDENLNPHSGYGLDTHSMRAAELIKEKIGSPAADVHFLVGGTQTNMILISSVLKPYQAVISASTGHINVHETGAIEGRGHKILTKDCPDGKLAPADIRAIIGEHTDEHMVMPKLVYISQTSELGTIYSLQELKDLYACCQSHGLFLYIDGARLASALTTDETDFDLSDIAGVCDAFSIGGTKNGLLFGEALVILNRAWQEDFRYQIKHFGGMLAKGFLSGLQFETLFSGDLYLDLARHANRQAGKIAKTCLELGIGFYVKPVSNQLFPVVSRDFKRYLEKNFVFSELKQIDNDNVVLRFVTSWATGDEAVDALRDALESYLNKQSPVQKS